jgi:hypothetical protein
VVNPLFASVNLEVDTPFNFQQMKADAARLEAAGYSYNFNIENPKHKYFIIINVLDTASTVYAIENRNTLREANFLLPSQPKPEELLLHKALVIYILSNNDLFSNHPNDEWFIDMLNAGVTLAVLSNLYKIHTNE